MIPCKILKHLYLKQSKIFQINFKQFRSIRRAVQTPDNLKQTHSSKLIPEYKNKTCSQTSIQKLDSQENAIPIEIIKTESKYVEPKQLTKRDKQSIELLKLVPKDNLSIGSFNLAAYVNGSETLQQLLKLGVDLSKIEKRKGLGQFVLNLDFERDIKQHIIFLNDIGITPNKLGEFITKNPLIFKENFDDLQVRINYLESKKFKIHQIQRICSLNPFWLMFSTKRIDKRLGYFQQNFKLSGDDIRHLTTKQPKLITYNMEIVRENTFCIKEEMGFEADEIKCLLLSKPKLWMMKHQEIIERFDYAHNTMKLSHDLIIHYPEILLSRLYRIQQRHKFLEYLGKACYNVEDESEHISPKKLVEGTDEDFVINICKVDMDVYENFLKKL